MKIVNVMNFVRAVEPREYDIGLLLDFYKDSGVIDPNAGAGLEGAEREAARINEGRKALLETTRRQLQVAIETEVPTTFLLQYDALCDEKYVQMLKNAPDYIEVGLWYEIVKEMADDAGLEYKSEMGWTWDWHIEPGFSMSYVQEDREKLAATAMKKFKEVFGYYPKTVGSWLIDTYTINYMADNYELDAFCICRDEVNTDAYTLIGGYFNQGYYPSRNNMFTPARSEEMRVKVPVLRLLGPDPLHNYDSFKYVSPEERGIPVFTMECATDKEPDYRFVDWYYKNTFTTEDMGFSYTQIGQENSFGMFDIPEFVRMRIEKAKEIPGVEFLTMGDTGRAIKAKYGFKTPVSANVVLDNWDTPDLQCAYYNCENYVANLFRCDNKLFIRALYLFDEKVYDHYYEKTCKTFDAVYENQPVVDTVRDKSGVDTAWYFDSNAESFVTERLSDTALKISMGDMSVTMDEDGVIILGSGIYFDGSAHIAKMTLGENKISFEYSGRPYSVNIAEGSLECSGDTVKILPVNGKIKLVFEV